jgi:hypothetical protein
LARKDPNARFSFTAGFSQEYVFLMSWAPGQRGPRKTPAKQDITADFLDILTPFKAAGPGCDTKLSLFQLPGRRRRTGEVVWALGNRAGGCRAEIDK